MARFGIADDRVRRVVAGGVVPAFAVGRSVAGAAKMLNDALQTSGLPGLVHPNRIHALLSDDPSRGLNEASLSSLERAVSTLFGEGGGARRVEANRVLDDLRARAAPFAASDPGGIGAIAARFDVPPAVLRISLTGERTVETPRQGATSQPHAPAWERRGGSAPDWSHQDDAYERVIDALRRRPLGRIGLVLPTGAGKTRTALRIVLAAMARSPDPSPRAIWVVNTRYLRTQAYRELRALIAREPGLLPRNAMQLAASIEFLTVAEAGRTLASTPATRALAMVVVDEARHAAAPSCGPVLEGALEAACPVLMLTATPNRTDGAPFGVDEIAYAITYRELASRSTVLLPEFIDFPVEDFDWSEEQVARLVTTLVDETAERFEKTLVIAPRIDRVKEFHDAFVARLAGERDHPLAIEDVGYVHSGGNSLGIGNEDFLARFALKPKALIVSAQLLLEGFDDPAIDSVVVTYPSGSVPRLMQAAGRCVRSSPGKHAAYVVQARNDALAYHFDQRWLVQEISDRLRPELLDARHASRGERDAAIAALLERHNVPASQRRRAASEIAVASDPTVRILLYGYPYFGEAEAFDAKAAWGALVETAETSAAFRSAFNLFCAAGADRPDPATFLAVHGSAFGLRRDPAPGSLWSRMVEILTAADFAREEIHCGGLAAATGRGRPVRRHGPTTWLRYATFSLAPRLPQGLESFLADCHNGLDVEAALADDACGTRRIVKIPVPLGGSEATMLDAEMVAELDAFLAEAVTALSAAAPADRHALLAGLVATTRRNLTPRLAAQAGALLRAEDRAARTYELGAAPVTEGGRS